MSFDATKDILPGPSPDAAPGISPGSSPESPPTPFSRPVSQLLSEPPEAALKAAADIMPVFPADTSPQILPKLSSDDTPEPIPDSPPPRKPLEMELTLLKTPTIKYAWLIGIIAAVLFILLCCLCYHHRDRSATDLPLQHDQVHRSTRIS